MRLSKRLFYTLVLLIPVNLGRHFVLRSSYVYGLLVDYLIPTLFVQDILVVALIVFWFLELFRNKEFTQKFVLPFLSLRFFQYLVLFLTSLLLSVFSSGLQLISWTYLLRTILYSLVTVYIYSEITTRKDLLTLIKYLTISTLFLSILGSLQFFLRGSVFDNYLFFGEQPYSLNNPNLNFEYFLNYKIIPPYGLFRHPNVFGGFLSLVLPLLIFVLGWRLSFSRSFEKVAFKATLNRFHGKNILSYVVFILGVFTLLMTFSYISYLVFFLGSLFLITRGYRKRNFLVYVALFFIAFTFVPFLSNFRSLSRYASLYRRRSLLVASYKQFESSPLFGVGYGLSTNTIEDISSIYSTIRFVQPVHNIFAILFSEGGIFAGVFFILMFIAAFKRSKKSMASLFLFQLLLLSCLDHYLFTAHQTHLIFWLLMGLSLLDNNLYDYN